MVRIVSIVAVGIISALLIGCGSGFDQNQIMTHPEAISVASTFDVALVNTFVYLDSASTFTSKVERDSLHLLVGMPQSWSVVEAKMTVIHDLDMNTLIAMQEDSLDEQAVAQMFENYRSQAVAMQGDASLPNAISGMTIAANDQEGIEDSVEVDNVENWIGFSAPVNIVFEKGSKVDTVIPMDSMGALMGEFDSSSTTDPMFQALIPDSIGMSMIPVMIYLKIKSGNREGTDTLYYFSKTGSMDFSAGASPNPLLPSMNLDVGAMTYMPVTVTSGAGVRHKHPSSTSSAVTVTGDLSTGGVRINLGTMNSHDASINIYSLTGNLIKTIMPARIAVWNGTDEYGSRVPSGTYLIKINTSNGSVVHNIQVLR